MAIKFEPRDTPMDYSSMPGDTHREKANWHRKRAGKLKNATITAVGKHTYAAGLLDAGVGHHHPDHPEHEDHEDMRDHDFAYSPYS